VPGRAAYLDGDGARCLRLNYSASDEATIREGVRRIGAACGEALRLAEALSPPPRPRARPRA
jgi:DNA-binding transcriptional MocR family regulator